MRGDARLCRRSRWGQGVDRKIDRLMSELPDRCDRTEDEKAERDRLKQTALFFFRPHKQGVGRFVDFGVWLAWIHKDFRFAVPPYAMPVPR